MPRKHARELKCILDVDCLCDIAANLAHFPRYITYFLLELNDNRLIKPLHYLPLPMIFLASELPILALNQTKLFLSPGKHAHTASISFTAVY